MCPPVTSHFGRTRVVISMAGPGMARALAAMAALHAAVMQADARACLQDTEALAAFKETVYDDPRRRTSNWRPLSNITTPDGDLDGEDGCRWRGIVCTRRAYEVPGTPFPCQRVLEIEAGGMYCPQNIFGNIVETRGRGCIRSDVSGWLVPELGNLTMVVKFHLSDNNLNGTLPPELGRLQYLEEFDIEYSKITGTIPEEYGGMTRVKEFDFEGLQLTGTIPKSFSQLKFLEELEFDGNRLTGCIPELSPTIQSLELEGNDLSGPCSAFEGGGGEGAEADSNAGFFWGADDDLYGGGYYDADGGWE